MYLPLTINGEDVIIDYIKKELVFPNRQEDKKSDYDFSAKISIYLKEEGFLDFDLIDKSDV